MNTYLTIMVTVLVATQIIRIVQNTISLWWNNRQIKNNIEWINERELTKKDFDVQREVWYLLWDHLLYLERKRDSEEDKNG